MKYYFLQLLKWTLTALAYFAVFFALNVVNHYTGFMTYIAQDMFWLLLLGPILVVAVCLAYGARLLFDKYTQSPKSDS